ncbi:MAG TPA: radical SAM protein [Planctomycetota bacterium]
MIPLDTLDDRRLHLVILPTEACHFRCTYCFEDFRLGRMPPGVVEALKAWLARRAPDLDLLEISWFGGEPLLASDLLLSLQSHAVELSRQHPRMNVRAHLTTNGHLLTREVFRELLALRVSEYQITLDGPEEVHDRTRRMAGGGPTFAAIWRNLLALQEVEGEFGLELRIHLHRENAERLPELLQQCAAAFAHDRRFRLTFKALFHPGHEGFDASGLLEPDEAEPYLSALRTRAADLGLAARPSHGAGAGAICYAAKANSFVVRSDGTLGKCSVALSAPENRVGRLELDGTVSIDGERVQPWLRGLFSGEEEARRCPLKGIRAGAVAPA